MPEFPQPKHHAHPLRGAASVARPAAEPPAVACDYAELHCLSNFSFLRGASHPEELVEQAGALGYRALAITDRNSLAGVVRAHVAAQEHNQAHPDRPLKLIIGAEITPRDGPPLVLLAPDRRAYAQLSRLITLGRVRCRKGDCDVHLQDVAELGRGLIAIITPELASQALAGRVLQTSSPRAAALPAADGPPTLRRDALHLLREAFGDDQLYLGATLSYDLPDEVRLAALLQTAQDYGLPLIAVNQVYYHTPQRRYLQDVLTCIREHCTLQEAGTRLQRNAQRHLRPLEEIARRYVHNLPAALARVGRGALENTLRVAQRCTFRLDELRYEYPHELVPPGVSPSEFLEKLVWQGARQRYGESIPPQAAALLRAELALIAELRYEHYFLTVWDLCRFARSRAILCQGRGSAANSAVCYCLGVTAVDPTRIELLFERFISRERAEPPDIDVDFEHERREEVFQYIYQKYGRERAAITAEVITYRPRSAVRDVGKTLGLSLDRLDALAKSIDWYDKWTDESAAQAPPQSHEADAQTSARPQDDGGDARGATQGRARRSVGASLNFAGLDPRDRTVRMLVRLVRQILGFPRHLSQHVGGFVITESPLCEMVPLLNGAMPGRTFIEWDKDDIDALGILKVDCLALGMLTAISKCLALLNAHADAAVERDADKRDDSERSTPPALPARPLALHNIPAEDPAVYDMICAADTLGVFQIESRAQMSMLPRLRPRCFYDLVIEVAIVRPGPIQGGMVHPYLRRRDGLEPLVYPSPAVQSVLQKTLGVPLFQEQVMRLAVVCAGFTPGEADQLRRSMAAWRRSGRIERFQQKLIEGMLANGYPRQFAEQIFNQIRGFGEYGFPESHAASFSLLVYASAWLKRYHPDAFCAAMLNAQPLGFYSPGQLIRDAQNHGVEIRPLDVCHSDWDCTLEPLHADSAAPPAAKPAARTRADRRPAAGPAAQCGRPPFAVRLGFRTVRGLSEARLRPCIQTWHKLARQFGLRGAAEPQRASARGPGATAMPAEASESATAARTRAFLQVASPATLARLAAANAFRSLGLERRAALWQVLALDERESGLFTEQPLDEDTPTLPAISLEQTIYEDYEAQGFSLNAHPMQLIRGELARLRVLPSGRLSAARDKQSVRVAGLVTCRQRPSTAKGTVFITLEDETGMANLIVRANVWERDWRIARHRTALLAEGRIERQASVVHVMVTRFRDLPAAIRDIRQHSRDFH